jgi:hypothetical protein
MRDELSDLRIRYSGLIIQGIKTTNKLFWITILQLLGFNVLGLILSLGTKAYMFELVIFILSLVLVYNSLKNKYLAIESLYREFRASYTIESKTELLIAIKELEEYNA